MAQVEAIGIVKNYRKGGFSVPALRGIDLVINSGEIAALCGPSGSGKSTLLNIMAGFDRPDAGTMSIDGEVMDFSSEEKRRTAFNSSRIGFVFQSFNLIPVLSAQENVELPLWAGNVSAKERQSRAIDMLTRVGLADRAHHRPGSLSGGQQQRVAVARALITSPQVVFADEPTANLDGATARDLLQLMQELNQTLGTTFVIATHDERTIRFASRVLNMEDGEIRQ